MSHILFITSIFERLLLATGLPPPVWQLQRELGYHDVSIAFIGASTSGEAPFMTNLWPLIRQSLLAEPFEVFAPIRMAFATNWSYTRSPDSRGRISSGDRVNKLLLRPRRAQNESDREK